MNLFLTQNYDRRCVFLGSRYLRAWGLKTHSNARIIEVMFFLEYIFLGGGGGGCKESANEEFCHRWVGAKHPQQQQQRRDAIPHARTSMRLVHKKQQSASAFIDRIRHGRHQTPQNTHKLANIGAPGGAAKHMSQRKPECCGFGFIGPGSGCICRVLMTQV